MFAMQAQRTVRHMSRGELDRLQRDFSSRILPHLKGETREDYDLVFAWEKFVCEKGERISTPDSD